MRCLRQMIPCFPLAALKQSSRSGDNIMSSRPLKRPKYVEEVLRYPESLNFRQNTSQRWINGGKRAMLVRLTEGFYAGNWEPDEFEPEDNGIAKGNPNNPGAIQAAEFAISMLKKKKQMDLQFVELVRTNMVLVSGTGYYLTIKASDNKFYEAKVYTKLNGKRLLRFIRHARHYPEVNPEFLEYDSTPAAKNV